MLRATEQRLFSAVIVLAAGSRKARCYQTPHRRLHRVGALKIRIGPMRMKRLRHIRGWRWITVGQVPISHTQSRRDLDSRYVIWYRLRRWLYLQIITGTALELLMAILGRHGYCHCDIVYLIWCKHFDRIYSEEKFRDRPGLNLNAR